MVNVRLRDALNRSGVSTTVLASRLGVDPKTVERWVSHGRAPYPRHRSAVAAEVKESESWLWPEASSSRSGESGTQAEVVQIFGQRAAVPADRWLQIFSEAKAFVDLLAYAALFLPEQQPAVVNVFKEQAARGVRVRLLMGDPDGDAVRARGAEEGIGDAVAIKTRNALGLLQRALGATRQVEIRLHNTTLYTSIYRGDDVMIVNQHVLGLPAAQSPAMQIRRLGPAGLFDTYTAMYDRLWDAAKPAGG